PAAVAHVWRDEESLGIGVDEELLVAGRRGTPDREAAVAVVVVDERHERALVADEPGGRAVAGALARLRQREADRPQALERGGAALLLRLLQRVLRPLLLGPRRGPWARPRRRRRSGGELADDLETLRAHRLHETAAGQDLPAVLGDRGRAERLGDLVERGGRGAAPLLEKVLGRARESGDRLPLRRPGLLEGLPVGSGERSGLRLA